MPMTLLALDDAEYVAEALKARGGVGPDQGAEKKYLSYNGMEEWNAI